MKRITTTAIPGHIATEEGLMNRVLTVAGAFGLGATLALALSFVPAWAQGWEAPADAKAQKNPVPKTPESIAAGQKIASMSCTPCHGPKGKGDGPAAVALPKKPADWTSKAVQEETDGSLFWKISKGNPPMPPWESLPEQDRWNLVNYIKSLGAK